MKILYLYAEVMGYTVATISELAKLGHEIHVIHWDSKKQTPYIIPEVPNVFLYSRSKLSLKQMEILAKDIAPKIVVLSGWMDKQYLVIARQLKKRGASVVLALDTQWKNSYKQKFLTLLGSFGFISLFYTHAWVAGIYQFEYAKRLGYSRKTIILDLYSANLHLFNSVFDSSIEVKKKKYPHRFLYVGRFEYVKGIEILLQAWQLLNNRGDWELHLIGSGSLKKLCSDIGGVVVKDFMQPEQLIHEVANYGCFVLPSVDEPWGVVVHEFAAAGLPLIVADVAGAASAFLISGFNGYNFRTNDSFDLASKMQQIINKTEQELCTMSLRSHLLAQRITPETSAANLLSVLH